MPRAGSFEELDAWQAARQLASLIYQATARGDFSRDFALRDQIRRAAVSVMSNIAEGFGRFHDAEFRNFLRYSRGSVAEVQSQLYVSLDAGYLSAEVFRELYEKADKTLRMVSGLIKYLQRS